MPHQKGIFALSSHCEGHASAITDTRAPTNENVNIIVADGHTLPSSVVYIAQGPVQAMVPAAKAAQNPAKEPSRVLPPKSMGILRPSTRKTESVSDQLRLP